jgi:hypothetical protein
MVKSLDDTVLKGNDVLVEINSRTAKIIGFNRIMKTQQISSPFYAAGVYIC